MPKVGTVVTTYVTVALNAMHGAIPIHDISGSTRGAEPQAPGLRGAT